MYAPSKRNSTILLATLLAGQFMANMDITIVNVAMPSIGKTLRASGAQLELTVSGYVVAYALLFIFAARLGKVLGYGRLFVGGLAGFTAFSLGCALAPSPGTLVAARLFQGAFAALMVAQVLTGIQLTFTGTERARAIGMWGMTLSLAAAAGQIIGGSLVSADFLGTAWRPVFLINLPIGIVLAFLATIALPLNEPSRGSQHPLAIFPLVHREVIVNPRVAWGLGGYGAALSIYFSLQFIMALYLQHGHGHSALYSGLTMLSWVIAFGVAGVVLPRAFGSGVERFAPYGGLVIAIVTGAVGALLWRHALSEIVVVVLLGFGGFGLGVISNATMTNVTNAVSKEFAPDVSGLAGTNVPVSGAIGVSVFGTAYLTLVAHLGTDRAFAVVAAGYVATALLSAFAGSRLPAGLALRQALR